MNYELTVLRGISACKKQLAQLDRQCREYALNTFSADCRGGTYAQALELAELVIRRDKLSNCLADIAEVFRRMPEGYRALLTTVYVRRVPREVLAQKYNVSLSTVYRKLAKARSSFRSKMDLIFENMLPEPFGFFPAATDDEAEEEPAEQSDFAVG